jgi:hypothetical protein
MKNFVPPLLHYWCQYDPTDVYGVAAVCKRQHLIIADRRYTHTQTRFYFSGSQCYRTRRKKMELCGYCLYSAPS